MERTQIQLRSKAVNESISLADALAVGKDADRLLEKAIALLKVLRPQFGLFVGGEIETIIAEAERVKPRAAVYYHEKEPDGQ